MKEGQRQDIVEQLRKLRMTHPRDPMRENDQNKYSVNFNFSDVIEWMQENKKHSIIDLGAGYGDCLSVCDKLGYKVKGIEINRDLIIKDFVIEGDAMQINESDIAGFDVIYSYGPFKGEELTQEFINHVLSVMNKNQTFLYVYANWRQQKRAGNTDYKSLKVLRR